ncbi:spore germination protein [Clostridium tarantellae]|uniref:Spore germination protein n=1 Tax=Clostridium tarantellae TaxID=39493 RepID=A0A6I1MLV9_9CLOT|nr:spore germination protein [Clostridium tarantellae]MPQ43723.1 spore germination protein [Clostridium tarantellae]
MQKDLDFLKNKLKNSFDVKYREVHTALGEATIVFIDVLCSTQFISEYIVEPLTQIKENINTEDDVLKKVLNINILGFSKDQEDTLLHVLSGDVVILFNDFQKVIYCETKGFVRRGVGTPITEAVVKGPREGFTEAFVDNVTLVRRRIKNANLKFEPLYVGNASQTVVCLSYIEGLAPKELIDEVREKINSLDYEFILDTNYIEATLRANKTVFDTVGYTEKADELCAKILEGRVAVMVDGTPFVISVPYFFLENFQTPDDYYLNRYFTSFTRILRWLAFFIAMFLPALYVSLVTHHFSILPSSFVFRLAVARAGVPFPIVAEVIIMMILFQLIKEAGLRLPQPIGTSMSIVAALILGDAAVGAGIASKITIIVVAISTVSYFLIPKLYGSVSMWTILITATSALYGLPGVVLMGMILIAHLGNLNSCGYPYLFPLGSLKSYKFKDIFFRGSLDKISNGIIKKDDKNDIEEKVN